jgi:predicted DNA-binding transcriptional regulator AlpA
MSEHDIDSLRVLRPAQVYTLIGLSASRVRQLEAAGQFPKRFNLGTHATAWRAADIAAWLAERIEAGRTPQRVVTGTAQRRGAK